MWEVFEKCLKHLEGIVAIAMMVLNLKVNSEEGNLKSQNPFFHAAFSLDSPTPSLPHTLHFGVLAFSFCVLVTPY